MYSFFTHVRPLLLSLETPGVVLESSMGALALEVIDGPYVGVVYSYQKYTVLDDKQDATLSRVRFETMIHKHPDAFVPDEQFDNFCADILVTWLEALSKEDNMEHFETLLHGQTRGVH